MIYVIFEVLKLVLWIAIIILAIVKRKVISVDIFWLMLISSVLMALGSCDDLLDVNVLINKSNWWLPANLFIIAHYFASIKRSCKFHKQTKKKINEFIEQIEKDRKQMNERVEQ